MKLINLNIWSGTLQRPLLDFFRRNCPVDIFCLQEVYWNADEKIGPEEKGQGYALNIFDDICRVLDLHEPYFCPLIHDYYGLAMLVRRKIEVLDTGEIYIHRVLQPLALADHSRKLQFVKLRCDNQVWTICNMHGLWDAQGKHDTPARLSQSKSVLEFIKTLEGPVILCGDLNIRPNTQSLKNLEHELINLVKVCGIGSTRTRFYKKQEKYADYVFVSKDVSVKAFYAMRDEISDHAPLFLEFS